MRDAIMNVIVVDYLKDCAREDYLHARLATLVLLRLSRDVSGIIFETVSNKI